MSQIDVVLNKLRDWQPRRDGVGDNPFRLGCTLAPAVDSSEVSAAWRDRELPEELMELWLASGESRLFEDLDYGQWGLHILSPTASAARTTAERDARPSEFFSDDVVIGEFLGDQDLLLFCPSEPATRRVLVALPLDPRPDWHAVGTHLSGMLEAYLEHGGDKFWERSPDR